MHSKFNTRMSLPYNAVLLNAHVEHFKVQFELFNAIGIFNAPSALYNTHHKSLRTTLTVKCTVPHVRTIINRGAKTA